MNLPAELPKGEIMGKEIDKQIFSKWGQIKLEKDSLKRLATIATIKKDMRKAFDKIVISSNHYNAHLNWVKKLELHNRIVDVRPTLSELYIYKNNKIGNRLKRLMRKREKLRAKAYNYASPTMDKARFAYPEEFEGSWLKEMGSILGYPNCCVDAYASDRVEGINLEKRASQQIEEIEQHAEIEPLTYFTGYFFPCSPNCKEALSRGNEFHEGLCMVSSDLGNMYMHLVVENLRRVHHQPESITEYRKRANRGY